MSSHSIFSKYQSRLPTKFKFVWPTKLPTKFLSQECGSVRIGEPYGPNQPNALFYCATIGA